MKTQNHKLILGRIVLVIAALMLLGFGLAFLIAPLHTMNLAGLSLQGDLAATELRAYYGGLEIALAALLFYCAFAPKRLGDGLVLSAAIYGGIGSARLLGIIIAQSATPFLWFALSTELATAALCLILLGWKDQGANKH